MNYQHIIVAGRVTRDAEKLTSKQNKDFVSFSVAVNKYRGKDKGNETTFYDCLLFDSRRAAKIVDQIKKGDVINIHGKPEVEAYINKDGEAKAQMKVLVSDWAVAKPSRSVPQT